MTSLLFIAPPEPAEAVFAAAALDHALTRLPGADLTVLCTAGAAPLFRAAPGLVATHLWEGRPGFSGVVGLVRTLGGRRFDLVLDLSGWQAGFGVRADERVTRRAPRQLQHRLEDYRTLLNADWITPRLWLDDAAGAQAAAAAPDASQILVIAPGADHPRKIWPGERFAAAARRLADSGGPIAGAQILLIGAAGDAPLAHDIAASLEADGLAARDLTGKLDLLGAAALLGRATLFIGNDGVWMQIAAAMKAATIGVFGPSDDRVFAPPWPRGRAVRGAAFEDVMARAHLGTQAGLDEQSLMADVSVDAVEAAALELLHAGGLR